MTTTRKGTRRFLALLAAVVVLIVVGALIIPRIARDVEAPSLVLENPVLIFPDPDSVVFTVSGAVDGLTWQVMDGSGARIAQGTQAPRDDTQTVSMPEALPTGYYTVSFSSPSAAGLTAAFGVTGPAPAPDTYFSVQTLSAHSSSVYRRNMDRLVPLLTGLGFSARRDSVYWSQYEEVRGSYETPHDVQQILDEDRDSGMQLFWTAGSGNPNYDDGRLPSSPEGIKAYADYIDAFLTEHPQIRTVEMFNEFNGTNDSACGASAECYLDVAKVVYPLVKARHPDVTVVAGGLARVSLDWWREFFAAGGAAYGDAFSYHPYDLTSRRLTEVADDITALIEKHNHGVGKPLYLSEIGWSISTEISGNPAKVATQAQQADRLVYSYVAPRKTAQVAAVNWYQAVDYGPTPTEYGFGLFEEPTDSVRGFQPKRAAVAFYVMRSHLDGYRFVRTVALGSDVTSYVFTDGEGDIAQVVWLNDAAPSAGSATKRVKISTYGRKSTTITDTDGRRLPASSVKGTVIEQDVSSSPVFVSSTDAAS